MTQQELLTNKDRAEKIAYKLVYRHLRKIYTKYRDIAVNDGASVAEARLSELSRSDFEQLWVEMYNVIGRRFYELQAKDLEQQKVLNNISFFDAVWLQRIINATKDVRIASLITNVTRLTKDHIRTVLASAAANRLAPRQIVKEFAKYFPQFVRNRSLTIARTETGYAAAIGIEEAAKNSGLKLYAVWYHATHGNSRDNHLALHLKYVPKGEGFDMGNGLKMQYPHDYAGGANENINCRCTHSYVTENVLRDMGLL